MANPTRFSGGINDASPRGPHSNIPQMDPTRFYTYFDDFQKFTAADWVITKVGTGTTALSSTVLAGGNLVVTNSAAGTDSTYLQAVAAGFKFLSTKRLIFKARWKVDSVALGGVVMGLQIPDTTPADVTDGLFFIKTAASAALVGTTEAANTQSTVAMGNAVADTFLTTSITYEPREALIKYWLNDLPIGTTPLTNAPSAILSPSFGVLNGSAVARVLTVDYIFAAVER